MVLVLNSVLKYSDQTLYLVEEEHVSRAEHSFSRIVCWCFLSFHVSPILCSWIKYEFKNQEKGESWVTVIPTKNINTKQHHSLEEGHDIYRKNWKLVITMTQDADPSHHTTALSKGQVSPCFVWACMSLYSKSHQFALPYWTVPAGGKGGAPFKPSEIPSTFRSASVFGINSAFGLLAASSFLQNKPITNYIPIR